MLRVKDALRLPALFLLFFILLTALLTGLSLLELRVQHFGEPAQAARQLVASRLAPVLLERFPAAVLFALVLTLFPLHRRPGNRFLSYLLPVAAAFVVLAFGGQALRRALPAARAPAPLVADYFLPQRFQRFGDSVLYLERVRDSRLEGVVVRSPREAGPRLSYRGAVQVDLGRQNIVLGGGGASLSAPARPAYSVLLAAPEEPVARLLAGFSADLDRVGRQLEARFRASLSSYYLACLILVFSFFAAGLFFRVSRWPLANVLLAFLVMRGYLLLFRWLRDGVARELSRLAGAPRLAGWLPEAALLALGVVLLLVDLLFLPYGRSREEPRNA
jgi:hypothetical protein